MDSLLPYVVQVAYGLTFVSYCFRDTVWLRSFAVVSGFAVIYFSLAQVEPLWIPLAWNALFVLVNAGHLAVARWRKRSVTLNALEAFLSKTALSNFPPAEVKTFLAFAQEGSLKRGQQLIRNGTELNYLFCLLQGSVDVLHQGKKQASLGPGRFVGEMSMLTQSHTRADVVAAEAAKFLAWPHTEIENWAAKDVARLGLLQVALGTQVVEELLRQKAGVSGREAA